MFFRTKKLSQFGYTFRSIGSLHSSADSAGSESESVASSSSSGSSLGFPVKRGVKRKANAKEADENGNQDDVDGSDTGDENDSDEDEDPAAKRLARRLAISSAAISANPFFASKNEILEPSIPTLSLDKLPPESVLRSFGRVDSIIETVIVIKAEMERDELEATQVLDEGSLVCLSDGRVLGPIFETFGAVTAPLYSIRFPSLNHPLLSPDSVDRLVVGMIVFYSPESSYSSLLFTRDIQLSQHKGSDASNLYDEEPVEAEVEFSDDDQEQEYRRELKQRRKIRAAARKDHQIGFYTNSLDDDEAFAAEEEDEDVIEKPQEAGMEEDELLDGKLPINTPEEIEDGEEWTPDVKTATSSASPHNPSTGMHSLALTPSLGLGIPIIPEPASQVDKHHSASIRDDRLTRGRKARGARTNGRDSDVRRSGNVHATVQGGRGRGSRAGTSSGRGSSEFRGRGLGRGGGRGGTVGQSLSYEPPAAYHQRTSSFSQNHGLPRKPAFVHPDALPYDGPSQMPTPYALSPQQPSQSPASQAKSMAGFSSRNTAPVGLSGSSFVSHQQQQGQSNPSSGSFTNIEGYDPSSPAAGSSYHPTTAHMQPSYPIQQQNQSYSPSYPQPWQNQQHSLFQMPGYGQVIQNSSSLPSINAVQQGFGPLPTVNALAQVASQTVGHYNPRFLSQLQIQQQQQYRMMMQQQSHNSDQNPQNSKLTARSQDVNEYQIRTS